MKKPLVVLLLMIGSLIYNGTLSTAGAQIFPSASITKLTDLALPGSGDNADVYFPSPSGGEDDDDDGGSSFVDAFPIVVALQGAFVDKGFYTQFGIQLARFGFVVVIPNRLPFTDQSIILEALALMESEDMNPTSLLFDIVDTASLGLTGHSFGGAAGLFAIEGSCNPPFCFGFFNRPGALRAGAFYGTNSFDPFTGQLIDVNTNSFPVALVQGSLDGIATPEEAQATFEILDGPRQLITIGGANHYGITNVNNPPGAAPDLSEPEINQNTAVRQVAQAIGQFLGTHVPSSAPGPSDDD